MSKPTLVLLPGKVCDRRLWENQIKSLRDLAEIIFIDLSKYSSTEEMLEAISTLSPSSFALAGFSMGGYLALEFVLREPHRVERLALMGASSRGYDSTIQKYFQGVISTIQKFGFKGLSTAAVQQLVDPSRYDDESLCNLVQSMAVDLGGEVFLKQQIATLDRKDRRENLAQIRCPVLVVGGRNDKLVTPEEFEELANGLPDAELHLIDGCGHMVPLEYPEFVSDKMREWLL